MKAWMIAAALALSAGPARAADNQIFVIGGSAAPITQVDFGGVGGGRESIGTVGAFAGAQYFYDLNAHLSLGAEIDAFGNGSSELTSIPVLSGSAKMSAVSYLGLIKVYLNDPEWIHFYLAGAMGVQSTTFDSDARPRSGYVWGDTGTAETRHFRTRNNGFAAGVGPGFELALTESILLGGEGRFQFATAGRHVIANAVIGHLTTEEFIFFAKAGLRF